MPSLSNLSINQMFLSISRLHNYTAYESNKSAEANELSLNITEMPLLPSLSHPDDPIALHSDVENL